jgi:hypothetical protein
MLAPRDRAVMMSLRGAKRRSNPSYFAATWIASLALAMTVSRRATLTAVMAGLDPAIHVFVSQKAK